VSRVYLRGMFVVVYRWHLKPGFEDTHRAGWRAVTESIRRAYGTGGSRLHRDADGAYIAYAVWPDEATWERARASAPPSTEADRALMREGIEGAVEVLHRLTVIDDLLSVVPVGA
jgi:heme-degrading monooxygenase HmoA